MMQRIKSKPEDNQLAYDESARPVDRASAISRIAFDGLFEIEPLLKQLLLHESFLLRAEAIKSLVRRWKKPEYVDYAIKMLHSDPEWVVRGDAALALSGFALNTGKKQNLVIKELLECLLHDHDPVVQRRIYEGLLQLLAPERSRMSLPDNFDREHDVDWELLKPYLNKSPIPQPQTTL